MPFFEAFKLFADRNKLNQVMRNLISNGLKFTPKDGKVDVLVDIVNGIVDVNKQISHTESIIRHLKSWNSR